jgi:hypothetical protein
MWVYCVSPHAALTIHCFDIVSEGITLNKKHAIRIHSTSQFFKL